MSFRSSLAGWEVLRAHADLHDPRLVDTGNANVLENLVVDLSFACGLNDYCLPAIEQGPERRRLGLLCWVRAEREVNASVGQVSVARWVGDPKLFDSRFI